MESSSPIWVQLILTVVLLLINAFFAAAEIAFVSVNRNKLEQLAEDGDKKATRVLLLLEDSDDFLATIQVAITLAGFLNSASAANSFAEIIVKAFPNVPFIETISIAAITLLLSYFTLVLGELYPKQVAMQKPDEVAMATSGVIYWSQRLFKPFVKLLSWSTDLLKKVTPIDFDEEQKEFTRDEVQYILKQSRQEGSLDISEFTMLAGVLSLDHTMAREIMTPRTDAVMIDIDDDYHENLELLLSTQYSRIPVYQDDRDNIIGIIHLKNLLKDAQEHGFTDIDLNELMIEPIFVPSTIYVDDLLVELRQKHSHMAVLLDEYGGVEGIVTMEDIIEEIVGEIEDETDTHKTEEIRQIDENNFHINGVLTVDKFNSFFDLDVEADEVDTMGGLVLYRLGFVPDDNAKISFRQDDYVITTSHVEGGRIFGLHVYYDPDYVMEADYYLTDKPEEHENGSHNGHSEKNDDTDESVDIKED